MISDTQHIPDSPPQAGILVPPQTGILVPYKLIIYGAGGLGRETLVLARQSAGEGTEITGFVDDGLEPGTIRNGAAVLGGSAYLDGITEPTGVIIAVADPSAKERIYTRLKENPLISFPRLAHKTCIVEPGAEISEGVVLKINDHVSIDAKIGRCVLLNGSVGVGHDTVIGDFSTVMPAAAISGSVTIGRGCLIGTSCAIMQGVKIGDGATVCMGSIVLRNVPAGATVMGNPARRI